MELRYLSPYNRYTWLRDWWLKRSICRYYQIYVNAYYVRPGKKNRKESKSSSSINEKEQNWNIEETCAAVYFVIWKGNHILSLCIMIRESWQRCTRTGRNERKRDREREGENSRKRGTDLSVAKKRRRSQSPRSTDYIEGRRVTFLLVDFCENRATAFTR